MRKGKPEQETVLEEGCTFNGKNIPLSHSFSIGACLEPASLSRHYSEGKTRGGVELRRPIFRNWPAAAMSTSEHKNAVDMQNTFKPICFS